MTPTSPPLKASLSSPAPAPTRRRWSLCGDIVQVSGKVSEFRAAAVGLTLTEITAPLTVTTLSSGNPLPAPVILGAGGLIPPTQSSRTMPAGSVETTGVFDPANDGIDFYESLEGMLVQVNDAVAVGPRSDFTSNREIPVVGDNGANAGVAHQPRRRRRPGQRLQPRAHHPQRLDRRWPDPARRQRRRHASPAPSVGVIDYSFSNFKLQVISHARPRLPAA